MKKKIVCSTASAALLAGSVALAGSIPVPTAFTTGVDSRSDTTAYIGLNWTLGGGMTPSLVLGVFDVKVKANGDTTGANLAFHANLAGGFKPGKLKLSYLDGRHDLQGELGLGFDFIKGAPLGFLGLNAPYVAVGVDAYLSPGFVPYVTMHSQGQFDKPSATTTTYSCPVGWTVSSDNLTCISTSALAARVQ